MRAIRPRLRFRSLQASLRALIGAALAATAAACGDNPVDPDAGARHEAADTLFASVAVGGAHSCALTRGGRAFCWGYNSNGQLGTDVVDNGRDTPDARCGTSQQAACATRPVAVSGGHHFVQLAVLADATCGLRADGRVLCWGGDPGTSARNVTPADVPGAPTLRALGTPQDFVGRLCGLEAGGRAWCWTPAQVAAHAGDSAQARPVGGSSTSALRFRDLGDQCGTTSAGALYCWNSTVDTTVFDPGGVVNPACVLYYSRTGPVTGPCTAEPVRLVTPAGMALRVAQHLTSCGLDADGGAVCWGSMLTHLLGTRPASADMYASGLRASPVAFPAPLASLFGAGGGTLCGRTAEGMAYCRGADAQFGLYGNSTPGDVSREPVLIAGGMRFISVDGGSTHMCGVDAAGVLYCWGNDTNGRLGSGGTAHDLCVPPGYWPAGFGYFCALRPQRVASIAGR